MVEYEEIFEGGGPVILEEPLTAELPIYESMAESEELIEVLEFIRKYPNSTLMDLAQLCDVKECPICHYLNALSKAGVSIRFQR